MVVMTRPGDGAGGSLVLWPASRRLPIVASNVVMNVQRATRAAKVALRGQAINPAIVGMEPAVACWRNATASRRLILNLSALAITSGAIAATYALPDQKIDSVPNLVSR